MPEGCTGPCTAPSPLPFRNVSSTEPASRSVRGHPGDNPGQSPEAAEGASSGDNAATLPGPSLPLPAAAEQRHPPAAPRPRILTHCTIMPRQLPSRVCNFLGPVLLEGNVSFVGNIFRHTSKDGNSIFFPKSPSLLCHEINIQSVFPHS